MERFIKPEIVVIEIEQEDTIATSGTPVDFGEGEYAGGDDAIDWPFGK